MSFSILSLLTRNVFFHRKTHPTLDVQKSQCKCFNELAESLCYIIQRHKAEQCKFIYIKMGLTSAFRKIYYTINHNLKAPDLTGGTNANTDILVAQSAPLISSFFHLFTSFL